MVDLLGSDAEPSELSQRWGEKSLDPDDVEWTEWVKRGGWNWPS